MEELIKQTEKNLNFLKDHLKNKIKHDGPTKISLLTGVSTNYLSDYIHGRVKNMSYEKILNLLKKIYKIT